MTNHNHPDSVHNLHLRLPAGVFAALQAHCARSGESLNHAVIAALADALDIEHHTLYQVSTSGALVEGLYQGCVSVGDIRRHGDFGLGTFDGLDGEAILLDGVCWQARGDGSIQVAPDTALAPFFVATHFVADAAELLQAVTSFTDLRQRLDGLRPSANVFVAIRLRGLFERIKVRTACKSAPGTDLVSATSHQAEFELQTIRGTLVGFWSPDYARTINVPGYHLHFISDDHRHGGHLLELAAESLQLEVHTESHLHLALPETAAFLAADLSGDPSAALATAEGNHR
ncbi:MAG: acetolactate decarboxylase [Cyanobacteria bacterium]|nr:acetolactate decarboxylase [Cyanobacteriota bacterium]